MLTMTLLLSGCGERPTATTTIEKTAPEKEEALEEGRGFGKIKLTISPADGKTIKGMVTITLANVDEDARIAAFLIQAQGEQIEGPNLGIDTDKDDGFSYILDTTKYENGVYTIGAVVGKSLENEGEDASGAAMTQFIIEN